MADIFISYAREDREWVEKLAKQFTAEGYSVWWDWDLLVGKRYRETIETELQTCKATVVVWSQHSIRSDFVRDEAEEGQQRNILVPLLKENVRPPAGFRQLQTADLTQWNGAPDHIEFQRMLRGLQHVIGDAPPAEADDGAEPAAHAVTPAPPPMPTAMVAPAAPVTEPVAIPAPPPKPPAPEPVHAEAPTPTPTPKLGTSPPPPMKAFATPPGAHAGPLPSPLAGMKFPPSSHPMWRYVGIAGGVFLVLLYAAIQFWPSSTPTPKKTVVTTGSSTPTSGGPTNPTDGAEGQQGNTGHGSNPPSNTTTPPANGTADTSLGAATDMSGLSADIAPVVTKAEAADRQARENAAQAITWKKAVEGGSTMSSDGLTIGSTKTDKGTYAGQLLDGKPQGIGALSFTNGDLYAGQFDTGEMSGAGVATFANTSKALGYSGQWGSNTYNGVGVFYLSNGQRFAGTFHGGKMTGLGALIGHDGKVIQQGTYEDGTLK